MSGFSSEEAMLADAKSRASLRPLDAIAYWQQTARTVNEDKGKIGTAIVSRDGKWKKPFK
jgi:hypothetical protein